MNHITVGVYMNGQYKINIVKDEDLKDHIEYNKKFRFGRGLFVDGKCVNQGYLSGEQVINWEKEYLKWNSIPVNQPSHMYNLCF